MKDIGRHDQPQRTPGKLWRSLVRKLRRAVILGGSAGVSGHVFGLTQAAQHDNGTRASVETSEFDPNYESGRAPREAD